jgi:hypothetical protein
MGEELVRVLTDPRNQVYETVPISQVPPGYIRVHIRDHGECYMKAGTASRTGAFRHPPFTPDIRAELRRQRDALARAGWDRTLAEWEDGFRRDMTPWREMAYWEYVVAALTKFTAHLPGADDASVSKRGDVFRLVATVEGDLFRAESHLRRGGRFAAVGSLTAKRVAEIFGWLFSDEALAVREQARVKYRELLRDRIADVLPDRVSLHALLGDGGRPNLDAAFNPVEFIATADVILGEDVTDPAKRVVFHGKDRLARLQPDAAGGVVAAAGVRVVWVELDTDTDEFDRLVEFVSAVKGPGDHPLAPPAD